MAGFVMTDSQQVNITVKFVDKKGNAATVPNPPTWAVDNTELLAVTPAADGMSADVVAVGPLGDGTVSVKALDNSGNTVASGSLAVTITGGGATTATLTPSTPTEQP